MPQEKATIHQLYAVPSADKDPFEQDFDAAFDKRDEPESCPKCYGTGMEIVVGRGARPCECRKQKSKQIQFDTARIPKRYLKCDFHNYSTPNKSQQNAVWEASKLTKEYLPGSGGRGLIFMGTVGIGKTHLAVAILKDLMEKGCSSLFYEFGALLKEIQSSYNPISKISELKVLQPIFDAEVLVLDEIGASKPTDWVKDTMAHIINTRYNDKKLTIFTTNYLDDRKSEREETLEDRIGVRLRSRLFEMCKTVHFSGDDYRKTFDRRLEKQK